MNKIFLKQRLYAFLKKPRNFFFQKFFRQDVLILVNNGNRDILGLLLVYLYLKRKHRLKVKIRSVLFIRRFWFKLYQPKLVVHISIDHPTALEDCAELRKNNILVLTSPTEIFATPDPMDLVSKYDYGQYIDGMLLPGERLREITVQNGKISPGQAYVIGYPTFDLIHEKFRKCFESQEEFKARNDIPTSSKIILFVSSFSMADVDMEDWKKMYFNWPKSLTRERVAQFVEDAKEMRKRSVSFIEEISKQHPNWYFIVRKHPFENKDFYKIIDSDDNPRTIYPSPNTDIHDLLRASDCVVHWNSTVSVQAWGMNKPTILLDLGKEFFRGEEEALSEKGNYICRDARELDQALSLALSGTPDPQEQLEARNEFIKKWFMGMDGRAAAREADLISRLVKGRGPVIYKMNLSELVRGAIQLIGYYYWRFLGTIPKMKTKTKKYDYFNLEHYQERFETKLEKIISV